MERVTADPQINQRWTRWIISEVELASSEPSIVSYPRISRLQRMTLLVLVIFESFFEGPVDQLYGQAKARDNTVMEVSYTDSMRPYCDLSSCRYM